MKYDIDSKFDPDMHISLNDLCKEIYIKNNNLTEDECNYPMQSEAKSIYNLFHNKDKHRGSGIIDILKLKLNIEININNIKRESKEKAFNTLRMLYLFYMYESSYRDDCSYNLKIPRILNLLGKPRQYNTQEKTGYGAHFSNFFESFKRIVPDSGNRIEKLEKCRVYWDYYIYKLFDYVCSDGALDDYKNNPEFLVGQLEYIMNQLKDLEEKVSKHRAEKVKPNEDIVAYTFNVVACHKMLAEAHDKAYLSGILNDVTDVPDEEYCELYKSYEFRSVFWERVDNLKDLLEKDYRQLNKDEYDFLKLIGYNYDSTKKNDYIYAFKHIRIVVKWYQEYKNDKMIDGINFGILVAIIQEIVAIKMKEYKVTNDYVGYKNKDISLMSALIHPDSANKIIVDAWIKRLEDRVAINFGATKLVRIKRIIDKSLYNLMGVAFSYRNIEDICFVNKLLYECVAIRCTGEKVFKDTIIDIHSRIKNKIPNIIDVCISNQMRGIIKTLIVRAGDFDKLAAIRECFAEEISKNINEELKNNCKVIFYKEFDITVNNLNMRIYIEFNMISLSGKITLIGGGIIKSDEYINNVKRLHVSWMVKE